MEVLVEFDDLVRIGGFELGLESGVGGGSHGSRSGDGAATTSEREGGELVGVGATFGLEGVDWEVFEFRVDWEAPRRRDVRWEEG